MVLSFVAAKIEPSISDDLHLADGASSYVAFGDHGTVALTDDDHIHLYQHDGVKYCFVGKKPLPDDVGWDCYKAISVTTIFLQQNGDAPTYQYRCRDLHQLDKLDHEGHLCGVVYPNTLVYAQRRGDEDWILTLHLADGEMILQPHGGDKWDWGLSVCAALEHILVVETKTKSMNVFTLSGNILLLF